MKIQFLFILFFCSHLGIAQIDSIDIPLFETEGYLKILSSDEMGGRKSGDIGYLQASNFVSGVLKAKSIKPLFGESYIDSTFVDTKYAPNVGGLLGKENSENLIVLGAHLDHVGREGNRVYNGANDNASGVVALLQIGDYLNKNLSDSLNLSILVLFFTAEEMGKLGSKSFAYKLKMNELNPKYMLNFEMLGKPISNKNEGKVYMAGQHITNLDSTINQLLNKEFIAPMFEADNLDVFQRSDNFSFYEVFECPAVTFITYNGNNYGHYHQPTDDYKRIDTEHLNLLIKDLAKGIHLLIEKDFSPKS